MTEQTDKAHEKLVARYGSEEALREKRREWQKKSRENYSGKGGFASMPAAKQAEIAKMGGLSPKNRKPRALRTHCKHGHEYTEENTLLTKKGTRVCRECNKLRKAAWYRSDKGKAWWSKYAKAKNN